MYAAQAALGMIGVAVMLLAIPIGDRDLNSSEYRGYMRAGLLIGGAACVLPGFFTLWVRALMGGA